MKTQYEYPFYKSERGIDKSDKAIESEWNELEWFVMKSKILPQIKPGGCVVEVGGGHGRCGHTLLASFQRIIFIEPDQRRINVAKNKLSNYGGRIEYRSELAQEVNIPARTADAVFCIHVLQHVSRNVENTLLARMSDWVKPGGQLVLFVTKKNPGDYDYNIAWETETETHFSAIPEEVLSKIEGVFLKDTLLVRKVEVGKLIDRVEKQGFKHILSHAYTFAPKNILEKLWSRLLFPLPISIQHKVTSKLFGEHSQLDVALVFEKKL